MSDDDTTTAQEIRGDIESTREELGDTVEALAAKTDVKAKAQQAASTAQRKAKENPVPLAVGGAVLAGFLLWRLTKRGG